MKDYKWSRRLMFIYLVSHKRRLPSFLPNTTPKGKRSKTGCGVFLPEHMLKLAMHTLIMAFNVPSKLIKCFLKPFLVWVKSSSRFWIAAFEFCSKSIILSKSSFLMSSSLIFILASKVCKAVSEFSNNSLLVLAKFASKSLIASWELFSRPF